MTGQEFKNLFDPMFTNPSTANVFAVVDNNGQNIIKKLNINDELQLQLFKSLTKDYKKFVRKINLDNQLGVFSQNINGKGIFVIDINTDNVYECPVLEEVKNHINDANYFNSPEHVFSRRDHVTSIKGIIYNIGQPEASCFIYRKYNQIDVFNKKKFFGIYKTNEFIPINIEILTPDPKIDTLLFNNVFYTFNASSLSALEEVKNKLKEKAANICNTIKDSYGLSENDLSKLTDALQDEDFMGKVLNIVDREENIPQPPIDRVKAFITDNGNEYNLKIKVVDDSISLEEEQAEIDMINVLKDNLLMSEITGNKYISPIKQKLEVPERD